MMHPYQYTSLPTQTSIRILILHPAKHASTPLEVDLVVRDRIDLLQDSENKTFDAVSYVWGQKAHTIPLFCRSEAAYLCISPVVDEMLRNFRNDAKERRLWIDALCLNQKDDQEKSVQVQQMGQIYYMASKVLIWLGPALPSVQSAFAFLRTLVAKFEPTPGQGKYPTAEETLDTFEKICNSRDFDPILNLLKHPWFTRRWTLQEGFLARYAIVCCGSNKISWHWFTEGLKLINHGARDFQDLQSNTDALYALQVLETLRDPADILSLLWKLHQNQCSDPRDRIYSLIGLAKSLERISPYSKFMEEALGEPRDLTSSRQKIPVPNYALEAQAVFRELAGQCILADQFLRILFHLDAFGSLSKANSTWPSWVPDWAGAKDCRTNSREEMSSILPTSQCIDEGLYCRMEIPRYEIGYGPILVEFIYPRPTEFLEESYHGLIIYGEFHERILEVCEPWPKSDETDDLIAYLFHWIHEKSILHSDDQSTMGLKHKVVHSLLLLITGAHFFGYEDHPFLRDAEDMVVYTAWARKSVGDTDPKRRMNDLYRMANLVYPILEDPWFFWRSWGTKHLQMKKHIDREYCNNSQPSDETRQLFSCLLDNVSRMMREGNKQLIVASDGSTSTGRRHWIGPNDVKTGDIIVNITLCGRIGVLLRPHDSPSELQGRPVFRLIGILWSIENVLLGKYEDQYDEYVDKQRIHPKLVKFRVI
ncbi:heterokaryon incompatibility protein-domain-containing protein [Fusarium oxysporum]|nr:heterokaryon incompatibility protein-domain-containing protein [Fusarium oxysporum]